MARKISLKLTIDRNTLRLADRLALVRKTSRSAVIRDGVRALAEGYKRSQRTSMAGKDRGKL